MDMGYTRLASVGAVELSSVTTYAVVASSSLRTVNAVPLMPNCINAWCMAGGRMAVYTGLINKLDLTDDELAQVMGHEIGHVLHRDPIVSLGRGVVVGVALAALAGAVRG